MTWKKPKDVWVNILQNAQSYEEWEEAAFQLDVLLGNDLWYADTPGGTALPAPEKLTIT